MMRDSAIAGLGVALLPMFIVGDALKPRVLILIDIGIEAETEFIYIAHPDGQHRSIKLRALADCLRKAFGSPPYWEAA